MSRTYKNIKIPYPTEGTIRSAQLNDTVVPENSVQLAVNFNFDRVGAMQTRDGVTTFATQLGAGVTAFGTLSIQGGVKRLFAQVGSLNKVYAWDGASWTEVRSGIANNKARFSQYLNRTWMVNGYNGDAVKTSNGGAFDTTLVPATLPKGDYIQAGFDGRVWVADKSKDVLYYTDQVQFDGTNFLPLTFDLAVNFIQTFSPQDGESITGLFRVPRALLMFKQNHIYRIYNASNVDPYPAYNVGTYSQESIIQAKDGIYFHHSSGFYKFTYDSQPMEISRRVIDFVKAISRSNYENIVGIYDGFDAVEWAVGAVTVEGVTYSNCVMRYTISTQVWTIYDYGNHSITAMITYDDGTNLNPLMGTSAGRVGKINSGTTDFGDDIRYEFIDRWRSFTDLYSKSKSLSGLVINSQNAGGAAVFYQTEKAPPNVWEYIDTIDGTYNALFPNANSVDFAIVRLRIAGLTNGTPILFHGIEVLSIQDKGFEMN